MDTGIGRSPGTDYFRIADQLTGEEPSHLRRTRDLVDSEVEARARRLPAAPSCVMSEPAGSGNGRNAAAHDF
jgi:hypothetical protein